MFDMPDCISRAALRRACLGEVTKTTRILVTCLACSGCDGAPDGPSGVLSPPSPLTGLPIVSLHPGSGWMLDGAHIRVEELRESLRLRQDDEVVLELEEDVEVRELVRGLSALVRYPHRTVYVVIQRPLAGTAEDEAALELGSIPLRVGPAQFIPPSLLAVKSAEDLVARVSAGGAIHLPPMDYEGYVPETLWASECVAASSRSVECEDVFRQAERVDREVPLR